MAATLDHLRPILYAATRHGVVALDSDGGEIEAMPLALNGTHVTALAGDGKGVLLAAGTEAEGVFTTGDGGRNWKRLALPAGASALALQSSGRTLHVVTDPPALYQARGAASAFGPSAGFASVWRERHAEGAARIAALVVRGSRVLVASDQGVVFLSEDDGAAFREVAGALPSPVLCLHQPAASTDLVLAGTGAGLYRSGRPGSEPWKHGFSDPDRALVTGIGSGAGGTLVCGVARRVAGPKPGAPAGADAALVSGQDERGLRRAAVSGMPVIRGRISAIVFVPADAKRVFAGTTSGEIFESRDGGESFRLAVATLPGVLDLVAGPAPR